MTGRSECPYCHGAGEVRVSRDPDVDVECDACKPELCAECRSGKHQNCTGWALDEADRMVDCACDCEGAS